MPEVDEPLVDAVLVASRALVAIAAASLSEIDDGMTLPQFRMLVELASGTPLRSVDLAKIMSVEPSTATRMLDRLFQKKLVEKGHIGSDKRSVYFRPTQEGFQIVARVTDRRRKEVSKVIKKVPPQDRTAVIKGLECFSDAAGVVGQRAWAYGWRFTKNTLSMISANVMFFLTAENIHLSFTPRGIAENTMKAALAVSVAAAA